MITVGDAEPAGYLRVREHLISGLPLAPISTTTGLDLVAAEPGSTSFAATPDGRYLNGRKTVHGGFLAMMLDSAMSCAVSTTLAAREEYVTVELKVNFVRAALPSGGRLLATGKVVHRGRTIATADGRIEDQQGRLIAHGTATCLISAKR